MANTNETGPVYENRQASIPARHTFPFDFSQAAKTAAGVLLCTIKASVDRPAQLIVGVQVITAFNSGTSDTITIGTTTGGTEIISSGITSATPGYYPATTTRFRYTADTQVYLKYTSAGTAPTTGAGEVLMEIYRCNTKPIL